MATGTGYTDQTAAIAGQPPPITIGAAVQGLPQHREHAAGDPLATGDVAVKPNPLRPPAN